MKTATWCLLIALAIVGIAGALERARDTMFSSADDTTLSPATEVMLEEFARRMGPAAPELALAERKLHESTANYRRYAGATLLHVLPAIVVLALGLTQFSAAIRSRHPRFHRVSGRIVLVAALAGMLSSVFFGVTMPYGGMYETIATVVFATFMLCAGARAYAAIRRRDIAAHREWMIRMFAIPIAVAVMRVLGVAWVSLGPAAEIASEGAFGLNLWVGWILTLGVAELWIRKTRPSPRPSPKGEGEHRSGQAAVEGISGVVVAGSGRVARAHETVD